MAGSRHTPRRRIVLGVSGLVLLLLAVVVVAGSQQSACVSCHASAARGHAQTSHASVTCYQCHLDAGAWSLPAFKSTELLRMYPAALLGRSQPSASGRTSAAACGRCHQPVLQARDVQEPSGGLRILHRACAAGVATCDGCHPTAGHGAQSRDRTSFSMSECVRCHRAKSVTVECDACHAGKYRPKDLLEGPFAQTHGRNWKRMHGLGDLDQCSLCHTPDDCAKCHRIELPHPASFGKEHGTVAIENPKICRTCHTQAKCDSCHGMPMPHPKGFLKSHSSEAADAADPRCLHCHLGKDCVRCHERHIHPGGAQAPPAAGGGEAQ